MYIYVPVIITSDAPQAFAVNRHTRPIGPAPHMRTLLPRPMPARWHACTPTLRGSSKAPSSKDTWSGSLKEKERGRGWKGGSQRGNKGGSGGGKELEGEDN